MHLKTKYVITTSQALLNTCLKIIKYKALKLSGMLQSEIWPYTLICNNNRTRDFRSSFFVTFLQFSQQPINIQKPKIRHLKGLIVDNNDLEGQDHSTIRD